MFIKWSSNHPARFKNVVYDINKQYFQMIMFVDILCRCYYPFLFIKFFLIESATTVGLPDFHRCDTAHNHCQSFNHLLQFYTRLLKCPES